MNIKCIVLRVGHLYQPYQTIKIRPGWWWGSGKVKICDTILFSLPYPPSYSRVEFDVYCRITKAFRAIAPSSVVFQKKKATIFPLTFFCQNIFFSYYPLIKSSFAKNNQFLFLFLFPTRRLLIVLPLFPSSNLGSGLCLRKECFSDYSFASIPVKFLSGSAVEGKGVES